ncbi:MAG: hypothetical protein PHE86_07760 [Candidatus Marinimicrobia bacterium]|nr:hypothetical protein [Candidatus Neomarinimicrobiota bacterium]
MRLRLIVAAAGMTFLSSFTTIPEKQAAVEMDSFAVVYLRYVLALFVLWAILRIRKEQIILDKKE